MLAVLEIGRVIKSQKGERGPAAGSLVGGSLSGLWARLFPPLRQECQSSPRVVFVGTIVGTFVCSRCPKCF